MLTNTPQEAVHAFFEAFNHGDLETIIALYEPAATMVVQPGQIAEGHAAIREALNQFLSMEPILSLEKESLVTTSDIALSLVQWALHGTGVDGAPVRMGGATSDVLRRQPDGRWLFVIDNPWGTGVLG